MGLCFGLVSQWCLPGCQRFVGCVSFDVYFYFQRGMYRASCIGRSLGTLSWLWFASMSALLLLVLLTLPVLGGNGKFCTAVQM